LSHADGKCLVDRVDEMIAAAVAFIVYADHHYDEKAADAEFPRSMLEEGAPILGCLRAEGLVKTGCAAPITEVIDDGTRDAAQPMGGVGRPSDIDILVREHSLIK